MKLFGMYLLGAAFGALVTWMLMIDQEHISTAPSSLSKPPPIAEPEPENETDQFSEKVISEETVEVPWQERLEKQSGKWISVDGQYHISFKWSEVSIGNLPSWATVEQRNFILGESLRFLSGNGSYTLHFWGEVKKSVRLIRQDRTTNDFNGITLYYEGHQRANSRQPLVEKEYPKQITEMLAKFETVLDTDTASMALGRIGLKNFRNMEHLDGESRWGETRGVIDLGIEGEWMIRYCGSQKSGLIELQLFRGSVDEYRRTGETIDEIAYPHIYCGYLIESPTKFRKFH